MTVAQDTLLRLLLSHRAMLLGYIASIVRDVTLAEDVFQDVSLLILKKGDGLSDEKSFPAWARKFARDAAIDAVRRTRKNPILLDDGVLDSLDDQWRKADGAGSPSASVDALRQCLERLTPRTRTLLDLRYAENIHGQPLADKLNQSLNTVYVALARAHKTLGDCIRMRLGREGAR